MSEDDPGKPYYFESDHVALKENADYNKLLHTITMLEAQRQQAAQDLESLYKAQDEALSDPLKFVEKLQRGDRLDLTQPQKVASLPEIAWNKYTNTSSFSSFGSVWHKTRHKRQADDGTKGDSVQKLKSSLMGEGIAQNGSRGATSSSGDLVIVRGRAKDNSKPASFNQLWTSEEQQRLENLLLKYPPEEVEARRWAKIATALGNRTPLQVASRVQKYFLTLAKEGLPVPGRMPNLSAYSKKGSHRHHKYNSRYYPSSTLLQSHTPPVWMTEDSIEHESRHMPGFSEKIDRVSPTISESGGMSEGVLDMDDPMFEDLKDQPEYKELMELQRLKRDKLQEDKSSVMHHIGYKCDNCSTEPIVGTRWHCIDCPSDVSFDFCDACSGLPFQEGKHNSTHRLHPVQSNILDSDYLSDTKSNYNYLDSNYMPGS